MSGSMPNGNLTGRTQPTVGTKPWRSTATALTTSGQASVRLGLDLIGRTLRGDADLARLVHPARPRRDNVLLLLPRDAAGPGRHVLGNFFFQNDPRIGIQPGQWYCLEFELKANTPGLHDGHQRMWINDQFKAAPTGLTVQ